MTQSSGAATGHGSFVFRIEADADADVLCRVANQILFANTCPARVTMTVVEESLAVIEFELRKIPAAAADSISRKLEKLTSVVHVYFRATD